jgi:hypothetical protein
VQIIAGAARPPKNAIAAATYTGLLRKPANLYAIRHDKACSPPVEPDFRP